jgi:hypothetical protein
MGVLSFWSRGPTPSPRDGETWARRRAMSTARSAGAARHGRCALAGAGTRFRWAASPHQPPRCDGNVRRTTSPPRRLRDDAGEPEVRTPDDRCRAVPSFASSGFRREAYRQAKTVVQTATRRRRVGLRICCSLAVTPPCAPRCGPKTPAIGRRDRHRRPPHQAVWVRMVVLPPIVGRTPTSLDDSRDVMARRAMRPPYCFPCSAGMQEDAGCPEVGPVEDDH